MILIDWFKHKLGIYSLREKGSIWVEKNLGEKYVADYQDKYDDLNKGKPIGDFQETLSVLDIIERIKNESKRTD